MSARAVLVCYCEPPSTAEWTYWDSTGQARQAEAELTPCGPLCIGVHSVVQVDLVPDTARGRWSRTRTTTSTAGADAADEATR